MDSSLTDNAPISATARRWYVYMILSSDDRLYTGITTDIQRRWKQHCGAAGGAKFFRGRKPKQLVYLEADHDRSSASRREAAIKKLPRTGKVLLLSSCKNIASEVGDPLFYQVRQRTSESRNT